MNKKWLKWYVFFYHNYSIVLEHFGHLNRLQASSLTIKIKVLDHLQKSCNILTVTHPKGTHVSNSRKRKKGIKNVKHKE